MQQNYTKIFTSLPARHMSRTKDAAFFFPSSDRKGFASLLFASLCLWLWEVGNFANAKDSPWPCSPRRFEELPLHQIEMGVDLWPPHFATRRKFCVEKRWRRIQHLRPRAMLRSFMPLELGCGTRKWKIAKHDNQEFGNFWNWIVLHFKTARPRASVPNSTYLGPIMSKQIYVQIWANKYMSKYVKI